MRGRPLINGRTVPPSRHLGTSDLHSGGPGDEGGADRRPGKDQRAVAPDPRQVSPAHGGVRLTITADVPAVPGKRMMPGQNGRIPLCPGRS